MSKGALRFSSVASMPDGMRAAYERQHPVSPAKHVAKVIVPAGTSEHDHQVTFIRRIEELALRDPRYAQAARRTHAIPNGGFMTKRTAGRLKAEGRRAGVPDIHVALAAAPFIGCYIEMKSATGQPSREQREWLAESVDLGYSAACCRGVDEAFTFWLSYVEGAL